MKNTIFLIMLLISSAAYSQGNNYVPGQILISFKNEIKHKEPKRTDTNFGIEKIDNINTALHCNKISSLKRGGNGHGGVYLLKLAENIDITAACREYESTGLFKSVSPNYIGELAGIPNDTLFYKQWSLQNNGGYIDTIVKKAGADIDMIRGWEVEDGDSSIVMAVIDAGVKTDHPEFASRFWKNTSDIPGNNTDDDNNGYIDDSIGWNFVGDTAYVADDHGHGTFVTGILGANVNNTTGYAGVDQHCRLMICKAADKNGFVNYGWLIGAIYYAVDNGAKVINISAGGNYNMQMLEDAVNYAYNHDVLIVAATGNFGSSVKWYPAGYKNTLSVGATGPTDTVAWFSNYGDHLCVVAPGEWIYGLSYQNDTATNIVTYGTSFAAPHVSGIATLLLAQDKTRTAGQLKQLIQNNAEDMVGSSRDVPGWDKYYGYGRVNAYRSLINEALAVPGHIKQDGVKLFPVPANDVLYIRSDDLAGSIINIAGLNGVIVYSAIVKQNLHAVNVRSLAAGVYLATIEKNGERNTVKFSVQ